MATFEQPIHNFSEIGELQSVLLHRPGGELENLTPDTLTELLFDDIPWLEKAQQEHDKFADLLRSRGAEVLYLDQLATEALADDAVKAEFIKDSIETSLAREARTQARIASYLADMATDDMVHAVMAGIRKDQVTGVRASRSLSAFANRSDSPFYLPPLPNLYFTRDPAAAIGNGLTINRMKYEARRRESLFMRYIVDHHPRFKGVHVPVWHDRSSDYNMEGGDELVLSDTVLAIGVSQRTSAEAIVSTARNLFMASDYRRIIAVQIPDSHAFMHLDTVFTMIDHDKFSIHPEIREGDRQMNIYVVQKKGDYGDFDVHEEHDLEHVLRDSLELDAVTLIECGGGDPIAAAREQWNDGSNTLAIAPGVVVTYDRNYMTNRAMRDAGLEVLEVEGAELGRGRGGPRCMSMPLVRKDIVYN
jgi:arginine deiminase